jgi:hypothetical protein
MRTGRTGFIRRGIVPWVVLGGLVTVGLSGCIVVPVPVYPSQPPGYGAPPPGYAHPAPGYPWGRPWR